ncbi:hypothetical protein PAPYR_4507 [Paratrimastix pyriformis]|uniref:Uncharacterized protein n=1 Tax=Paratrimastix pyriformis TaxID=342808 RepID=A0ABQ8UJR9_9EUKA|nr:hypothetical protein PAPYR_4507 [Paratrimastix pyriformis]
MPLVNPGDIVFVSGEMPRRLLTEVPEPMASEYLARFRAGFLHAFSAAPAPPPAAPVPAVPGPLVPAGGPPLPAAAVAAGGYKAVLFAGDGGGNTIPLWDVAESVQAGRTRLLLFDLLGGIYRHKFDPRLGPGLPEARLVAPDGRPLTWACWVLGAGSYGMTFRVEDTRDHSEAVLKATAARSALERAFFSNESYIAAAVNHPNVLSAVGPSIEVQVPSGCPGGASEVSSLG